MDFGEVLVDVRDRLNVPLQRVRPMRVFLTVVIELLGTIIVRLIRGDYEPSYRLSLPDIQTEIVTMKAEFDKLNGMQASQQQIEQAHAFFNAELARRQSHFSHQCDLWLDATRAGLFVGLLIPVLLGTSMFLATITEHVRAAVALGILYIGIHVLAGVFLLGKK